MTPPYTGITARVVLVGRLRWTRRTVVMWFANENAALALTRPLAIATHSAAQAMGHTSEVTAREALTCADALERNPWRGMGHLRTHRLTANGLEAVRRQT